jgi:hypothetical protein
VSRLAADVLRIDASNRRERARWCRSMYPADTKPASKADLRRAQQLGAEAAELERVAAELDPDGEAQTDAI